MELLEICIYTLDMFLVLQQLKWPARVVYIEHPLNFSRLRKGCRFCLRPPFGLDFPRQLVVASDCTVDGPVCHPHVLVPPRQMIVGY
jgi:hypothetical protein